MIMFVSSQSLPLSSSSVASTLIVWPILNVNNNRNNKIRNNENDGNDRFFIDDDDMN